MPSKFKKDYKQWDRASGKTTVHSITLRIHQSGVNRLYQQSNGKPKVKQKCKRTYP